jgi:hypothetical protein
MLAGGNMVTHSIEDYLIKDRNENVIAEKFLSYYCKKCELGTRYSAYDVEGGYEKVSNICPFCGEETEYEVVDDGYEYIDGPDKGMPYEVVGGK